jgi:arylsulfatase A-like enzyme
MHCSTSIIKDDYQCELLKPGFSEARDNKNAGREVVNSVKLVLMSLLLTSACGCSRPADIAVENDALSAPAAAVIDTHSDAAQDRPDPGPARKPNILLIVADDLGYNDLAINNGNTGIDTPNMDQIARDGVRFTRHYASAICSPARAALLTGMYPERVGFLPNGRGISPEFVTLPERLKEEGYTTWHIGKWHIGDLPRTAWPDHQGFDHWFGFLNQWRLAGLHDAEGEMVLSLPRYNNPWLEGDREPGKMYPGHLEKILTDKAISVLTDLNNAQAPWFLNLWFFAPHEPVKAAPAFAQKYPATPAGMYRALVNQLDFNIGQIIAHLDKIGALQNTIVVIVSDNGGTNRDLDNNAPFFGTKGTLLEGGLRTPLIIRWPDLSSRGQVYADAVGIEDIYPTLLESIGVPAPANLDGDSLYQGVRQGKPPAAKARFWDHMMSNNAVSYAALSADGRWRLYQPYPILGAVSGPTLSDLERDPTGTPSLQPVPSTQQVHMAQLTQSYQAWHRDVHTVKTDYARGPNNSGVVTGMDFLRTPGFGTYTFGIGVSQDVHGPIAAQAGVWGLRRTGDTVTAKFGDLVLAGDIQDTNSCHSIVVTGIFSPVIAGPSPPPSMELTLYIDGKKAQSGVLQAALDVVDPGIETIIGDPADATSAGTIYPPVILNTAVFPASPWTLESFSRELCNKNAVVRPAGGQPHPPG